MVVADVIKVLNQARLWELHYGLTYFGACFSDECRSGVTKAENFLLLTFEIPFNENVSFFTTANNLAS